MIKAYANADLTTWKKVGLHTTSRPFALKLAGVAWALCLPVLDGDKIDEPRLRALGAGDEVVEWAKGLVE